MLTSFQTCINWNINAFISVPPPVNIFTIPVLFTVMWPRISPCLRCMTAHTTGFGPNTVSDHLSCSSTNHGCMSYNYNFEVIYQYNQDFLTFLSFSKFIYRALGHTDMVNTFICENVLNKIYVAFFKHEYMYHTRQNEYNISSVMFHLISKIFTNVLNFITFDAPWFHLTCCHRLSHFPFFAIQHRPRHKYP